jgi:membrane protein DedA with SNARE-associated domain
MPQLIAHYGVFIVVLIIYAGEIGIPTLVPGEIAILLAASQLVRSIPQLIGLWILFSIVDIAACTSLHVACRTAGNRVLVRLLRLILPRAERQEDVVEGWRRRLGGHDSLVVFVTRLIPMFRLYSSVTTGLIRVRFRCFVAGAVPASMLWASIPLVLGYAMRSKIRALQQQFPDLIHYVIIGSAAVIVITSVSCWVRSAGTRSGSLRRLQTAFGLGAVGGALSRIVLVAIYGDKPLSDWFLLPPFSALIVWFTCLSLVAAGLLWLAAIDLRVFHRYRLRGRKGVMFTTAAWMSLMLMFGALNTLASLQHPTALG